MHVHKSLLCWLRAAECFNFKSAAAAGAAAAGAAGGGGGGGGGDCVKRETLMESWHVRQAIDTTRWPRSTIDIRQMLHFKWSQIIIRLSLSLSLSASTW